MAGNDGLKGQYVPDLGRVPEPRQGKPRRSAAGRVIYSLFVTFALLLIGSAAAGVYGYHLFTSPGPLPTVQVFQVEKGIRTPEIAAALEKAAIISDARLFTVVASLNGARGRLKAGEFEFPAKASMQEVMNIIASGRGLSYKISIPEGFTTEMALERVKAHAVLAGDLTHTPPEGAIMPDTYVFRRGMTRDRIVADMVDAQRKLIADLWARRSPDTVARSKEEAVVLASIVEKETGLASERPRVAAVFANRLKLNMRLQSDPTIIYGIVAGKGRLDRKLTRADIAEKTPYNTYRINGLPPGPIANPGRAALEAVLSPIASQDLYFVADGSGGHAFAATLEEHNANVKKWRLVEKNRGQVEEAEAEAATTPPAPDAAQAPAAAVLPPADPVAAAPEVPAQPPAAAPEPAAPPVVAETPPEVAAAPDEAAAIPVPVPPEPPATPPPEVAAIAPPPAAADPQTGKPDVAAEPAVSGDDPAVEPEAEPEAAKPVKDPKPGSLVKVAKRVVPIPVPKPKGR